MNDLVDRKFKRNVYGLSIWTKTVKIAFVVWKLETIDGVMTAKPEINIIPNEDNNGHVYKLDEIVFIL